MPVYEYKCVNCNEKFSVLQGIHADENDTECPKCSSKKVKKMMSSFCCSSGPESAFGPSLPSRGVSGGG